MPQIAPVTRRTSSINLRALPAQRELIDRACVATHKKLTDFILEASCREAEHVLCDQRFFTLEEQSFKRFETALDTPLDENRAIHQLLTGHSPWDD